MAREFKVNTYAAQWQENPDAARLKSGGFVIVWDSFFSEDDLDVYYIAAQHYDTSGAPIGGERALSDGGLESRYARVTALGNGGYAVAYEASPGSILAAADIFVRSFDVDGTPRGDPRRANPAVDDYFFAPDISALPGGGFVALYTGNEVARGSGLESDGIYGRSFDAEGRPTGRAFSINQEDFADQSNPQATRLSNGRTVVIGTAS